MKISLMNIHLRIKAMKGELMRFAIECINQSKDKDFLEAQQSTHPLDIKLARVFTEKCDEIIFFLNSLIS